jgi:hypothetical protein
MPLLVEEVNLEKDFDELFNCQWAAWTNPPQAPWELMFPILGSGPSAEAEAIKAGRDRQLQDTKASPNDRWVKVIDTDTGKIIAGALWKMYTTNPYRAPLEKLDACWWPAGSELKELASSMYDQLQAYKPKMMSVAHACSFPSAPRSRFKVS